MSHGECDPSFTVLQVREAKDEENATAHKKNGDHAGCDVSDERLSAKPAGQTGFD
ncbi:MAG: hypothetical protein OEZ57_13420 [Nitrospirota bacterium]|nr:hypothetical protein [Nitrospirota bacterium]MDH5588101.1 hypothetical protein [Nitrospirota bacterium]MDH5775900.1 hypothetical protein [Nitrospirota bacterium]